MNDRVQYSYVSIVPAIGWIAAVRGTTNSPYLAIVPDAGDAQLRLTVPSSVPQGFDAAQWVEHVAEINRQKLRAVFSSASGDFMGYNVQFETEMNWERGWALHCGKIALDAYYSCHKRHRGRDDDVVCEMLASLRLESQVAS